MKNLLIATLIALLAASITMNYLEFQRYSSKRAIVRMDSGAITFKDYQDRLDYQYGKQVLNKLVYTKIIADAAAREGVSPTDKDVDERVAEINRRNPQLVSGAKDDPNMMDALRADLAEDIGLENLRAKNVSVGDAEVAAFYAKNLSLFSVPPQVDTTIVAAGNDVDAATAKALLEQQMNPTQIAHQPRLSVVGIGGFSLKGAPKGVLDRVLQAASHLKDGEITTLPVGNSFLIIRADRHRPAGVQPLSSIRPLVTRICRLQKAVPPDQELTEIFRAAHVKYEVTKYAAFFQDIEDAMKKAPSKATATP